jgi:hypothetical protein
MTRSFLVGAQLLLVALVLMLSEARTPITQAEPNYEWDARLDNLNVTVQPATNCSDGCWKLYSAQFQDRDKAQHLHHVWARAMDASGTYLEGVPWYVGWPSGGDSLLTKAPSEWADYPLWDCYGPNEGETGAYRAYMGNDETRSDVVRGMGLPYCQHVNYRLIWQWTVGQPEEPAVTATVTVTPHGTPYFIPIVEVGDTGAPPEATRTPTPTVTATVTTTPTNGRPFTGSIVQTFVNCGLTQVFGVVHDANGAPLSDVRVRLTWDGATKGPIYTTSGDYIRPETDTSGWDIVLQPRQANTWRVAVVDGTGNLLSPEVPVQTHGHCDAGAVNVAKVRFVRAP